MTIQLTERAAPDRIADLRQRHDQLRRRLSDGRIFFSHGIVALGLPTQLLILDRIETFDEFDDADPTDLHDIGDFEIDVIASDGSHRRELIFFRILNLDRPILTLMLAIEW